MHLIKETDKVEILLEGKDALGLREQAMKGFEHWRTWEKPAVNPEAVAETFLRAVKFIKGLMPAIEEAEKTYAPIVELARKQAHTRVYGE